MDEICWWCVQEEVVGGEVVRGVGGGGWGVVGGGSWRCRGRWLAV